MDDGSTTATFAVTEGSTETYSQNKSGNSLTGLYTMSEMNDTGYSFTEVIDSTMTLGESGDDAATVSETGDDQTGDYSQSETGVDLFTLSEDDGATVTVTLTGTDNYATSESGNSQSQSYTRTTTGGGNWDQTGATIASGTNAYTLNENGDPIAGVFGKSETGTDRYALVPEFIDVSNTNAGTDPGNVVFLTHGVPFRDPSDEEASKSRDVVINNNEKPKLLEESDSELANLHELFNKKENVSNSLLQDFSNRILDWLTNYNDESEQSSFTLKILAPVPKSDDKFHDNLQRLMDEREKNTLLLKFNEFYGSLLSRYNELYDDLITDLNDKLLNLPANDTEKMKELIDKIKKMREDQDKLPSFDQQQFSRMLKKILNELYEEFETEWSNRPREYDDIQKRREILQKLGDPPLIPPSIFPE